MTFSAASARRLISKGKARLPACGFCQPQAEGVQLDEAFGVALVVDLIGFEGDMSEAV